MRKIDFLKNNIKPNQCKLFLKSRKGFSLIEIVLTVAIISVLAAVAIGNWGITSEVRDAAVVQSAQAALQQVIAQGATRADVSPSALASTPAQRTNIVNAANLLMQNRNDVNFTDSAPNFLLRIPSSGRTATFSVSNNGDVLLQALNAAQWTDYTVDNGVIARR